MAYKPAILLPPDGGTGASTFTQSNGIVTYNGTRLVNYAGAQIDSSGRQTNTSQPSFSTYLQTSTGGVTGDNTVYTVLFDTIITNVGTGYASGTGIYTAPVTGNYLFTCTLGYSKGATVASALLLRLVTTARTYSLWVDADTASIGSSSSSSGSLIVPMTANDTAKITFQINGNSKSTVVEGNDAAFGTTFSGMLLS